MAEIKKTVTAKTAAKTEPAAKAEPVAKAEPAAKTEAPAVKAEAKPVEKAPEKKPAAKKTTAKKEPVKKAAEKVEEKPAEKKTVKKEAKQVINLQFAGKSYSVEDLQKIAGDVWKYDLHKEDEEYTSLELYVKPEESIAYYVFNGDITGSFFI